VSLEASASHGAWHCPRSSDFLMRGWEDGVVVYDDRGAFLHLLTPIAGEFLALVREPGGHDAHQLARSLMHDDPADGDLEMIQSLLEQLSGLGLIERLPV